MSSTIAELLRLTMSGNYIERVYAKEVRAFKEISVEFSKGFNFIAGENGVGKTSILAIISHCTNIRSFTESKFTENSELHFDAIHNNERIRCGHGEGSIKIGGYREDTLRLHNTPSDKGAENRRLLHAYELESKKINLSPLFIGAVRSISYLGLEGIKKENNKVHCQNQYRQASTMSLINGSGTSVKQWIINRYFIIDKGWAWEEKNNFEHFTSRLAKLAPFDSDFKYVDTGRDMEPVFELHGKKCYLEQLSSGFQSVLTIVTSIIEWIEKCNDEGSRDIRTASGTVIIDELDAHLHPEWQLRIRDGLEVIFPNVQFIVTTHSPHLIASAKENEVIVMRKSDDDTYDLKAESKSYSGWTTDQILKDVMGVKGLDNKLYAVLIDDAFDKLADKDIRALEESIVNLEKVTHPDDTICMVLRTKLAGLKAVSDEDIATVMMDTRGVVKSSLAARPTRGRVKSSLVARPTRGRAKSSLVARPTRGRARFDLTDKPAKEIEDETTEVTKPFDDLKVTD
ncbi:AAA family ATPase [Psychromonas sp. Urea-02u-13]|uniref:AAA family ATPase n=1 Tax=Psychromonas sp. Urea-02u-13 TaxID=2058326 RepID=UPI000C321317|nr:AAA family ATPase [Psychromonas sp. Urea-02u-13]PKG37127.1 ATP-binding protein [Psychromonas sp. Urea-02u-13]